MRLAAFVGLVLSVSACSLGAGDDVRVFYVAPETAECVGVVPQTCLLVREQPEAAWELFYDSIEGFAHEQGTEYVLEVEAKTVADPPADGSSLRYRLVRILQSRQVPLE